MHYGFTFNGNKAHCREGYVDAAGVLAHLGNVDAPLKAALQVADLDLLEVHGPKDQVDILRESDLAGLGCQFYDFEWGFRLGLP